MDRPIEDLQLEDGPTGLLLRAVEKGEKLDAGDVRREGPVAQRLLQLWDRLVILPMMGYSNTSMKMCVDTNHGSTLIL